MALDTLKTLSSTSPRSKWTLLFIILVGGFLRIYKLDSESLWYDELHSIIPTAPAQSLASIIEYCKTDQPPFFFLYLHYFFKLFGYSEWIGRLASALVGIAAIPVMFALGKEIQNVKTGLFAAGLTSINYFHIYYSQELRFYSMAFLLSALSFFFMVRIINRNRGLDYVLYTFSTSALLYTHYYGVIIFVTQIVILGVVSLLPKKREPSFYYRSLAAGGVAALSFIPWLPTLLQDTKIEQFWIPVPKIIFPARYFFDYTGKDEVSALIFGILILLFIAYFFKPENRKNAAYWMLVVWISVSLALPYFRSIFSTPILHVRYTIVTLPAWILLIAIGFDGIRTKQYKYILALLVVVSSITNLFIPSGHFSRVDKPQLRETSKNLAEHVGRDSIPILSPIPWHFNYYLNGYGLEAKQFSLQGNLEHFWFLQSKTSTEMDEEFQKLIEGYRINQEIVNIDARALLLEKK